MLVSIDRFVLSVFERLAHFIQRNFGIKPISIAMVGEILFACSLISRWFIPNITHTLTSKVLDVFILSVIFLWTILIYPRYEKNIDRDSSQGLSNKNKIDPIKRAVRIVILMLFTLTLVKLFRDTSLKNFNTFLQGFGLLVAVYFIACDPLPPAPSRFRKMLQGFFSQSRVTQS